MILLYMFLAFIYLFIVLLLLSIWWNQLLLSTNAESLVLALLWPAALIVLLCIMLWVGLADAARAALRWLREREDK